MSESVGRLRATCIVGALLLAQTGIALAASEKVTIIGDGQLSCGAWTQRKEVKAQYYQQEQWLWGYITAYNFFVDPNGNVSNNIDGYGLAGWMDNFCLANPLQTVLQGANSLIVELRSKTKRPK